ncbi:MAG TPA: hypothetical protein VFD58_36030 [Blastocatellia bacterium]|nr:hypothetical protein [Blastocatellia bacterium]
MYESLGICLALAALLTINALATLAATAIWRGVRLRAGRWSAAGRAQLVFSLRVLPAAIAAFSVIALLVPAYAMHEPYQTTEVVSLRLAALALLSMTGILLALWRGLAAWVVTRRLLADWLGHATPIRLENVSIPAYRLDHSFPVIAIVGSFRPRLFIADHIFDALNKDELSAAIRHEQGHLRARDNLRNAMLRACRDALSIAPCGRTLDCAWAEASEEAADEYAARAGAATALDLAAALVKIARLIPAGTRPSLPAGALLIGDEPKGIAARVRRLTALASSADSTVEGQEAPSNRLLLIGSGALAVALLFAASNPRILAAVHSAIESIVAALQ